MILEKILWIALTAFIGGSVGLIFWRYQRHKEKQDKKENLRVLFSVGWTNNKNEFHIKYKIINTGEVPVVVDQILYDIKRSGKYARTVKGNDFQSPFDTVEFRKHHPFQYIRHKLIRITGFSDQFVKTYRTLTWTDKDERPRLNNYGDECLEKILQWDHTINNTSKIRIATSVVTSTDAKFKGKRVDLF